MKDIVNLYFLAFFISLTFVQGKLLKLLFLIKNTKMPMTFFFTADEISRNGACKRAEITKTYNKGWQTYISMGNGEIRDKISDYFNWDNNKMNVSLFYDNFKF